MFMGTAVLAREPRMCAAGAYGYSTLVTISGRAAEVGVRVEELLRVICASLTGLAVRPPPPPHGA